jgi:hypothetical protein
MKKLIVLLFVCSFLEVSGAVTDEVPRGASCFATVTGPTSTYFMRILRDETGEFESMDPDTNRHIVMFTRANVPHLFFEMDIDSILLARGYHPDFIRQLKERNTKFRVIFVPETSGPMKEANWENLIQFVETKYSKAAADFISAQLPSLRVPVTHPRELGPATVRHYHSLQKRGPFEFRVTKQTVRGSPSFIDEHAMLTRIDLDAVWRARAFLEHELKLTERFTGTGSLLKEDLSVGETEYFWVNQRCDEIPGLIPFDLPSGPR